MRITIAHGFFLPIPPAAGGAMEKMWWALAREFAAQGHTVTSFSRRWPGWPDQEIRESVQCLRRPGFAHTRHLVLNLLLDGWWGLRALRHLPTADILVTNTVLLPALAPHLRPSAGQVVVSLNRMPKGQLLAYRRIARLQAPSAAVAAAAAAQAPRLAPLTRIFPNLIDYPALRAAHAARARGPGEPLRLGYIGRLHPEKGLRLLLQAARLLALDPSLPAWTLSLRGPIDIPRGGGGDTFAAELHRLAGPLLASGQLTLLPPEFSAPALARAYAELDIFAYPSLALQGETFGVSVAEAMAAGAAVITSDLPCFSDLVVPDQTGLTFARDSSEAATALASSLAKLMRDPIYRARLALAGQAAVAHCDTSAVAKAMLADFASLLRSPSLSA